MDIYIYSVFEKVRENHSPDFGLLELRGFTTFQLFFSLGSLQELVLRSGLPVCLFRVFPNFVNAMDRGWTRSDPAPHPIFGWGAPTSLTGVRQSQKNVNPDLRSTHHHIL